ncbi:hypothetical protein [Ralstonia chuxiongensis]|uniref:hypothetical protein n=1 Tax=Ralstonia chuxiongensis TaxID=2957504 RepID=UPI002930DE79|nr:hypothetical protein [Ralstonia chuxiongensis]
MKTRFATAVASTIVTTLVLGGCASAPTSLANKKVSVTTYASAESAFFPKRRSIGAGETRVRNVGEIDTMVYPLMAVRSCNQTRTSCALGVVKLVGTTELKGFDADGATVAISLTYDIGRKQTMSDGMTTVTNEIPTEVEALTGHRVYTKLAYLPYGEMRKVSFDHGVDFVVCTNRADEHNVPLDSRCEVDGIQNGTLSHASLHSLP